MAKPKEEPQKVPAKKAPAKVTTRSDAVAAAGRLADSARTKSASGDTLGGAVDAIKASLAARLIEGHDKTQGGQG